MTQAAADLGAERILDWIMSDPRAAERAAGRALADARAARDPTAQAIALRALGLCAHALHDPNLAATRLRGAIRVARRARAGTAEAEARMSYALVLDDLGRPRDALAEVDRACSVLGGLRRGRAIMQRALVLRRIGRDDDAMAGYQKAMAVFQRHDDRLWLARTLVNRGMLHVYRGELAAGQADLDDAERMFTQLGLATAVAQTQHNMGLLAARAGDVRAALHHFDRSGDRLRDTGAGAITEQSRAELFLLARLMPEARAAVTAAISAAATGRMPARLGQAQLLAAEIALVGGDAEEARRLAARARVTFARQDRRKWTLLARRVEIGARIALNGGDRRTLRALEECGDQLAEAAWPLRAWDAWIDAGRVAVAVKDLTAARRCVEKAAVARTRGPAPLRARAWHGAALLALHTGDVATAKRRAAAAYRAVERHQASLGATELGVHGGAAGVDSAGLRLRLCLDDGDRRGALRWLQRVRAAASQLPPARPAEDPFVRARLAELRALSAEMATADHDSARMNRLVRRQRAIETEIRHRSWQAPAITGERLRPPSPAELASALGNRALMELFVLDDTLHALVLVDGRVHHRVAGAAGAVAIEVASLRFGLERALVHRADPTAYARAARSVAQSADALDGLLFHPLSTLLADRDLVLVPTAALHALPWSALPSLRGRPVSVNPSSVLWWQRQASPRRTGDVVLIAGPAPEHAPIEVRALHRAMPGSRAVRGAEATAARVLASLDAAATGHIACHGEFRADNPLFSHLSLADGPLTLCDLSTLRNPPDLLVLSCCRAGVSAVHAGDEVQGLAMALLALGTRTVIASLGLVDDAATKQLMLDFHARLRTGGTPAAALAAALASTPDADRLGLAGFVCLGVG